MTLSKYVGTNYRLNSTVVGEFGESHPTLEAAVATLASPKLIAPESYSIRMRIDGRRAATYDRDGVQLSLEELVARKARGDAA